MSTVLENFKNLISQMMKARNVEDYELYIKGNPGKGNGYMGFITFFKIVSKGNGKMYHLVMKSIIPSKTIRNLTAAEICFDRELYMYTVVLPNLKSFIATKTDTFTLLEFIPRLYWYSGEYMKEALILENLKNSGYTMPPIMKSLDMDHMKLVIRALGRWHGVVMAYRDQNPKLFQTWIPHIYDIRFKMFRKMGFLDSFLPSYYKNMYELLENRGHNELARKYKNIEENILDHLRPVSDENDRLVIVHGDCWLNNLLFKYEENSKKPTSIKLLDYQFSSFNTPVEDLSFVIYGCCDKDVLNEFDTLLADYYATLSTTIASLGSNPQNLFTFDQLEQHWKKYGLFGVLMTSGSVRLQYIKEGQIPDLEFADESFKISSMFDFEICHEDEFFERIFNVLVHYGNKYMC